MSSYIAHRVLLLWSTIRLILSGNARNIVLSREWLTSLCLVSLWLDYLQALQESEDGASYANDTGDGLQEFVEAIKVESTFAG